MFGPLVTADGWVVDELPEATVEAIMTLAPLSARPEDDLADVVAQMLDRGVRSVPVVDHGEVVGIVSRRDVLRCVARQELTSQDVRQRRRTGSQPIDTASMPGIRA